MLTFSEQSESVLGPLNLNREIENMKELLQKRSEDDLPGAGNGRRPGASRR